MTDRLHNKIALITGAASGIGAAIADCFVTEGAQAALVDQNGEGAAKVAEGLNARYHGPYPACAAPWAADVTDAARLRAVAGEIIEHFGRIDILINCAGVNVFADPVTLTPAAWQRCMSVNLEGAWHAIQAVLPGMLAAEYGHIVNIASVHGHKIIPGAFPYPVAKHGLIGLTRSLGIEYAAQGIRVNAISPGLIRTPAAEAWLASLDDPEAERARQCEILPCKRLGEPEEVAQAALFLASDEARFINATDLVMDGGRSQIYHD